MVTINPARHMRVTPWVGAIAPGRFADLVLLDDEKTLSIAEVWADGHQVSEGKTYKAEVPQIDWPEWARRSVSIQRSLTAADFALRVSRTESAERIAAAIRKRQPNRGKW